MTAAVATVTVSPSLIGPDNTQRFQIFYGTMAIGASPLTYTTGGIACDLSGLGALSQSAPFTVDVKSQQPAGSGNTNQYVYVYLPGTTSVNGLLQIFTGAAAQTALTELSSGAAIPSGVSGDTITFVAKWIRGI